MKINKSIKSERGVTLTALVITIIVILILSAVTIGMALNQNGIISKTKESTNEYQNAMKNEYQEIENATAQFDDNNLVKMFKDGEINIGDYVSYTIPETGEYETTAFGNNSSNGFYSQKFDVNNNGNEIKWRILGLANKNGELTANYNEGTKILLISGSPVQKIIDEQSDNEFERNPYLYMGKAEGYENSSIILNGICNIYLNEKYAEKARSINVHDINTLLGIEVSYEESSVYTKDNKETNIDILRTIGRVFYYNQNTYSSESYAKYRSNCIQGSVKGTGYCYLIDEFRNSTIGSVLFSQTDRNSGYAKSYWLDSRGIDAGRIASFCVGKVIFDSISLGCGEFTSNGKWNVYGLGVYPVIVLKSDITIDDIEIVSRTDEDWNYKTDLCYTGNIENYETNGTEQRMFR